MGLAYILGQIPTNYGAALSLLPEMLVAAGWTYQGSGDAVGGYSATGKVFLHTGTGANGWNNSRAWARMRDPAGGREIVFQHDAAGGARIKYSVAAKFIGGTPSGTTTPSATDERYLRGGGTDATPTYGAAWFHANTGAGGTKVYGHASDQAPFGFWYAAATTPAGGLATGLMMDPLDSVPEDPDPVAIHVASTGAYRASFYGDQAFAAAGAAGQGCWGHFDVQTTKFSNIVPAFYVQGGDYAGSQIGTFSAVTCYAIGHKGLDVNPFNGAYEALPFFYVRPVMPLSTNAPWGIKGWSRFGRWTGVARSNFVDTLDSKKWICVGDLWLPWDGVTTPMS